MMQQIKLNDFAQLWKRFLIEMEFTRNYGSYGMHDSGPSTLPFLEAALPGLLHIKSVAFLDHVIRAYIDEQGLTVPKKPYGTSLKGQIDFLADQQIIANGNVLHDIREIRNALAHEPQEKITWKDLDRDVASVNSFMQSIGLAGDVPNYNFIVTQHDVEQSADPKFTLQQRFDATIYQDGKKVASYNWSMKFE